MNRSETDRNESSSEGFTELLEHYLEGTSEDSSETASSSLETPPEGSNLGRTETETSAQSLETEPGDEADIRSILSSVPPEYRDYVGQIGEAIRRRYQSHYTQKFQEVSKLKQELEQARQLWEALEADPVGTLRYMQEQYAPLLQQAEAETKPEEDWFTHYFGESESEPEEEEPTLASLFDLEEEEEEKERVQKPSRRETDRLRILAEKLHQLDKGYQEIARMVQTAQQLQWLQTSADTLKRLAEPLKRHGFELTDTDLAEIIRNALARYQGDVETAFRTYAWDMLMNRLNAPPRSPKERTTPASSLSSEKPSLAELLAREGL